MQRILLTTFAFCWAALVLAQGLEGDFNSLSAKERSRIAKAEEEGASNDAKYQVVMAKAEEHFREQRFDEALEQFLAARDLRPYNVYPRVKIQDLQALIAKRDAALAGQDTTPAVPAQSAPAMEDRTSPGTVGTTPAATHRKPQERAARHGNAPAVERPDPAGTGADTPAAEGERIYKEGRAVVVERSTTLEGRIAVFRKVTHAWGEVMYFKDGAAIPERVWNEVFGSR